MREVWGEIFQGISKKVFIAVTTTIFGLILSGILIYVYTRG